jgi:hypothetical protein
VSSSVVAKWLGWGGAPWERGQESVKFQGSYNGRRPGVEKVKSASLVAVGPARAIFPLSYELRQRINHFQKQTTSFQTVTRDTTY